MTLAELNAAERDRFVAAGLVPALPTRRLKPALYISE